MKSILLCLFGIVVGFFIGQYSSTDKSSTNVEKLASHKSGSSKNECDDFGSNMTNFSDYKEAFELFIKRLGYKNSSAQMMQYRQLLKNPKEYTEKISSIEHIINEEKLSEVDVNNHFVTEEEFSNSLADSKVNLDYIDDESLKNELKGKSLSEPLLYYSKSRLIKSYKNVKNMNGRYEGKLYHIIGSKKGQIDQIDLEVNFVIKNNDTITGSSSLKLMEDGVVYSHKSGNGSNGLIRQIDGNIILAAGPGIFFHFTDKKLTAAFYYQDGKMQAMARFVKR